MSTCSLSQDAVCAEGTGTVVTQLGSDMWTAFVTACRCLAKQQLDEQYKHGLFLQDVARMVQSAADNEDDDDDEEDEEDSPAKPSITRGSKKGAKAAAAVSIFILRTVLTCSTLTGTHQSRWCCATVASLSNELCKHRSVRWEQFSPGPSMICHCHIHHDVCWYCWLP